MAPTPMGQVLLTYKDTDAWEGRDLLASKGVTQSRTERRQGKEEGQVKVPTHSCQAPGPDLHRARPCHPPVPTCLRPAHLTQTFCKQLISLEVRWGPQSSLSRNWHSWISRSLGGCIMRAGPESGGWGGWGGQRGEPSPRPRLLQSCLGHTP